MSLSRLVPEYKTNPTEKNFHAPHKEPNKKNQSPKRMAVVLLFLSLGSFLVLQTSRPLSRLENYLNSYKKITAKSKKLEGDLGQLAYTSLQGTSRVSSSAISDLKKTTEGLMDDITTTSASYSHVPEILKKVSYIDSTFQKLKLIQRQTSDVTQITPFLLRFFSDKEERSYIVLLQDNLEIRPHGGFPLGIFLVTFENGQVTQIVPYATSQFSVSTSPPPQYAGITHQKNFRLSDGLWDLDYPTSAKKFLGTAEKVFSKPLSGLISVNLSVVSQVLNRDVTNQYLQILTKQGDNGDFTRLLMDEIIAQLYQFTPSQISEVLQDLSPYLSSGDIRLYFSDTGLESALPQSLTGQLSFPGCRAKVECLVNFIYPVDTNISFNKTGSSVSRQVSVSSSLNSDEVLTKVAITYRYPLADQNWPYGPYKNYFRLILPASIKISSISRNSQTLPQNEYSLEYFGSFSQLSTVISISPSSTSDLEVIYSQPLPTQPVFHYQQDFLSQPGLQTQVGEFFINYPSIWYITSYQLPLLAQPGELKYNAFTSGTTKIDLDISQSDTRL